MPITDSGRSVADAIAVIEIDDVSEARMDPPLHILSSSLKRSFLISISSVTHSKAMSASSKSFRPF